ncbi:MAG: hypothetical protein AAFZ67_07705 [Planctomycetota bacterium]
MRLAMVASAALWAAGCETYEKDVGGRTFFSGLDGAVVPELEDSALSEFEQPDAKQVDLREVADDGAVTLRALTGRHLMRHIFETLRDEESDVFVSQVLSEATKAEFAAHGQTADDAYATLRESLPDIEKLFARMPMGEYTPNARIEPLQPGVLRVRLLRGVGRDLRWQGFDMIMEGGNQRLLWFYSEDRSVG